MKLDPNKIYDKILTENYGDSVGGKILYFGSVAGGRRQITLIEFTYCDFKYYAINEFDLNDDKDVDYNSGVVNNRSLYRIGEYKEELYDNLTEAAERVSDITKKAFCECEGLDKSDRRELTNDYSIADLDRGYFSVESTLVREGKIKEEQRSGWEDE